MCRPMWFISMYTDISAFGYIVNLRRDNNTFIFGKLIMLPFFNTDIGRGKLFYKAKGSGMYIILAIPVYGNIHKHMISVNQQFTNFYEIGKDTLPVIIYSINQLS